MRPNGKLVALNNIAAVQRLSARIRFASIRAVMLRWGAAHSSERIHDPASGAGHRAPYEPLYGGHPCLGIYCFQLNDLLLTMSVPAGQKRSETG
jgi:hypothetical protein